jgi:UDP-4-amino-4,6-dideoxy-N-acetyl-beta-L-altrosamine transaminase
MIPYGRQCIDNADVAAVVKALKSDWLTTGPCVEAFEKALAEYCGAKHAIAVCNGTAALHVAMLAGRIGAGQRVLTSANTFLASANCAEFVGATADFADMDPGTYNVTAETLRVAWKDDVRAIVPVDFAGQPCDMPAIAHLAREKGAIIIEDASHALGSQFIHQGKSYRVGGHQWADMTTLSFHPVKTITTGEGGAILTNDDSLAERSRMFRNHGMVRMADGGNLKPEREKQNWTSIASSLDSSCSGVKLQSSSISSSQVSGFIPHPFPGYYEMHELGYNYRITDLQCALGLSQLKKLDSFIDRRTEIVAAYNSAFSHLPSVICPHLSSATQVSGFSLHHSRVAWHLYVLQIDFAKIGKTRTQVMNELKERGIGTQVHYIPVHLQPYYRRKYGYDADKCPVAEAYYKRCLSLPLYPLMIDTDVKRVIKSVCEVTVS